MAAQKSVWFQDRFKTKRQKNHFSYFISFLFFVFFHTNCFMAPFVEICPALRTLNMSLLHNCYYGSVHQKNESFFLQKFFLFSFLILYLHVFTFSHNAKFTGNPIHAMNCNQLEMSLRPQVERAKNCRPAKTIYRKRSRPIEHSDKF